MEKILRVIGKILLIMVIVAFVPIVFPKLLGYQSYNVISGSMEPTIPVGSIVYVKPVDFSEISEGDIISFEAGASVVTHRVESIDESQMLITTKGDANETADFTPVAYTNVLGKAEKYFPIMGNVAAFISEPVGKIVAIVMVLVGAILSSVGEKSKKKKADEDEPEKKKKSGLNPKIILFTGLVIVFGSVAGFLFIYMGYQKSNDLYNNLNEKYVNLSETNQQWYDMMDVDVSSLQAINPDVIGWLYVEGTDISYPILYSGDDDKYLRMTMDGESATAGSIFLEGYNLPNFADSHNVIYGHNMRNLSMFGSLKFYKTDDNYLQEHKYFQIITADKKYRYEIFSYFDTDAASWVYGVPYSDSDEFGDYISELLNHSYKDIEIGKDLTSKDKVTTLSTCSTSGRRFTVHGYLCETY
ncbi:MULTISPECIES: class B sortase [Pseudobutyrivibrio]|uniref:Signal peptidase I n=1 Tax=Pseudobutyrivibrio xylanivorans TaxID=185007 RepID=A0A6M0LJF1_PSEXY|nr:MULTISPECIES: class B sortase [Pseudobutyrivibrio]NEX02708.1 class B sortase [Pseudobutyrivibrio xylanivorans]